MPRKPRRRQYSPFPFAFSKFARSVAHAAYALRKQACTSKFDNKSSWKPIAGGIKGRSSKINNQLSESSHDDVAEDIVQADFAFFDPKPDDFHGVKIMLQTYLDDQQWDISGFVDLIIAQTTVGTVVKLEDDEEDGVFGFVTVLNLTRYKAVRLGKGEGKRKRDMVSLLAMKARAKQGLTARLAVFIGIAEGRLLEVPNPVAELLDALKIVIPSELPRTLQSRSAVDHSIELEPVTKPPVMPTYRMASLELQELQKQLNELLEAGIIL